jgi:1-acyl-sn-glycerol-3-phosphate acyltransferase
MISYIASMCVALPVALFPLWLLSKTTIADRWINTAQRETMALDVGQWCARSLLVIMPFMEVSVQSDVVDGSRPSSSPPEPSIWVCNHTSMLDTFILLACDQQLRGPHKRPIKTIYWKGLEDNPICNLLFKMAGFIPVQMEANASGDANQYDKKSFVRLLRDSKRAFGQGFDLLILPEGQLNPWPQKGLLPVFPGAHKLSQMSGRPIRMVALHGCHNLWPANDSILDMTLKDKSVKVRAYHGAGAGENGGGRMFESGEEFVDTFRAVVGQFGATGEDLPSEELAQWFDGSKWKEEQEQQRKNNDNYCHHQQENSIVQEAVKQEISRVLAREEYDANEQPPTGSPTSRRQASHDEPMSRPHP